MCRYVEAPEVAIMMERILVQRRELSACKPHMLEKMAQEGHERVTYRTNRVSRLLPVLRLLHALSEDLDKSGRQIFATRSAVRSSGERVELND